MIWLKACHKCSGDMHFDLLAEEYVCLQCGAAVDRPPMSQTEPPLEALPAHASAQGEPARGQKGR